MAQPGRAPGSGPGGRRFKSSLPDQSFQRLKLYFWFSVYIDGVDFVDGHVFLDFRWGFHRELQPHLPARTRLSLPIQPQMRGPSPKSASVPHDWRPISHPLPINLNIRAFDAPRVRQLCASLASQGQNSTAREVGENITRGEDLGGKTRLISRSSELERNLAQAKSDKSIGEAVMAVEESEFRDLRKQSGKQSCAYRESR